MVGWAALAWAQDPLEPEPLVFNADRVLITTFQPLDAASAEDAKRLFDLFVGRFSRNNDVVPMSEVPAFDVQGYDAPTYMLGCPPGRYAGCELVLGQRTDAVRAIGAEVARMKDEFDEESLVLTVHIVDVTEAREVASFGVPVPVGREADIVEGVARVYDDVVKGDFELRDLRGQQGGSESSSELDAARQEILAQSLAELEDDLGTAIKEGMVGDLEVPRVTREDLEKYLERDDRPPWEQVGMSRSRYLRYANSGQPLDAWRRDGWGRVGRVIVRVSGGAGAGPWSQRYEGQVLRCGLHTATTPPPCTALSVIDLAQVLEVQNASSLNGDFEIGFGVLPALHVVFAAGVHTGETSTLLDEDVEDQFSGDGTPDSVATNTWQLGGRAELAPFPRWPARPTVGVGVASWKGSGIRINDQFERLAAPTATLLELLPGGEIDLDAAAAPFVRAVIAIPIAGTPVRESRVGGGLENPPRSLDERGPGFAVQLGVLVRLGPLFRPPAPQGASAFEDEP